MKLKTKILVKIFGILIGISLIYFYSSALAVPPPEVVKEYNAKATEAVVGIVLDIYNTPKE